MDSNRYRKRQKRLYPIPKSCRTKGMIMLHKTQTLQEEDVRLIESDALRSILTHTVSNNGSQYESSDPVQESVTALKDCVFFDIETTGLSADTAFIFLIGCICYDGHSWILHQFLIQVVQEESLLLSSFSHLVNQYRHLIHFNGTTFDLPFIQKRTVANSLEPLLIKMNSLDLYQYFRKLKTILNLSHMNQSALEKYTGWEREDCLSGKEMVSAFWNYAASKNPDTERLLLLHNRDD
ncbi:MAG: ribonuclease H-like domain-containing protein, partial [Clostridiales bacterium]|nr:ribonuclease H-like domain-containing protein [Clostridiales bacterium]